MTLHASAADWLHSPLDLFRAGSLAAQAGAGQAMEAAWEVLQCMNLADLSRT